VAVSELTLRFGVVGTTMDGMAELLTDDQVTAALGRLAQWRQDGDAIVRVVELASFPVAIQAVARIGEIAENDNHHPDIDIRWRTLTFRCRTHSAGGVTSLDVTLAGEIDGVLELLGQPRE
jgi:4a-hydroxytetrahydrobiopterin dehydratase